MRPKIIDANAYAKAEGVVQQLDVINEVSFLRFGEAKILYDFYAKSLGVCVEVGSRWGCSTMALALAVKSHGGVPLISIDPHGWQKVPGGHPGSFEIMRSNLQAIDLQDSVLSVVGTSADFGSLLRMAEADPFIAMLWIDGDHTTEGVTIDLETLEPYVLPGGIVCGHDYMGDPDTVQIGVDQYAARLGMDVSVADSIWYWEKAIDGGSTA
jgi:predicted O-methyltransferase YrrM